MRRSPSTARVALCALLSLLSPGAMRAQTPAPHNADRLAPLRALGPVVGPAIEIPPAGNGPSVALGWLGEGGVGRAAWLVGAPEPPDGLLAVDLPRGVRVLRARATPGRLFLFVQSVASLDQPDGAIGVVAVRSDGSTDLSPDEAWSLLFVASPEDLDRAVTALHPSPSLTATESERLDASVQRVLTTAARSPDALARVISPSGMFAARQHQRALHGPLTELRRETFASSVMMPTVMSAVRQAARASCSFPRCEFRNGVMSFERGPRGQVYLRALALRADTPVELPHAPTQRHEIAARIDHAESARVLREVRGDDHLRVLAEAPLTEHGGSIALGLAQTPDGSTDVLAISSEASAMRVVSLPVPGGERGHQVRFADLDGDGRTDMLLRTEGTGEGPSYFVIPAPPPSMEPPPASLDNAYAIATLGAPDLDAALRSALAMPSWSVTPRAACALLRGSNTLSRWRRIAARDARVIEFTEPSLPTLHPEVIESSALRQEHVSGVGATCPSLVCAPDRPYCRGVWEEAGPGSQHYYFTRERGALRLLGFAEYTGS